MNIVEKRPQCRVQIRWMIRRDMPSVLATEIASHSYPWTEEEFLRVLRQRNCIGMAAEHDERVVGFNIYEIHRTSIVVLDFAVDPKECRRGVGSQMIDKLKDKLSPNRRKKITALVRESNLAGQLFLRQQKFLAEEVIREHYADTGEDCYRFSYSIAEQSVLAPFLQGSSRFQGGSV